MGRQAYLTKIALGRSAFAPSQSAPQTSEYAQLESSQQEYPQAAQESNVNKYVQLYDERGNPINPRSHEHGRRFREAQNDVLASIGVVERRRSPSEGLPGSYEERLELLDAEDTAGNAIALASTLSENLCKWWIGTIRDRILVFRIRDAIPFSQIVASERQAFGQSLIYTGFTSQLLSTVSIQALAFTAFIYRPIDRLLLATHASQKTRYFFRRWKNATKTCLRLSLEFLFYPLSYHATLQRLGLIPARPLLPYWRAFIPFSKWSPISPFSSYYELSGSSPTDFVKAVCTSPLVFICAEHFLERWIYAAIYEAVESSVIHPDNPDMPSPGDGTKSRTSAILSVRRKSPPLIRNAINKLLRILGWGEVFPPLEDTAARRASQAAQVMEFVGQTADSSLHNTGGVGTLQIENAVPLQLPRAHSENRQIGEFQEGGNDLATPVNSLEVVAPRYTPPGSPTASQASQDDNVPRIRITSREDIVEMEVRLPPHILSTQTEFIGPNSASLSHRDVASPLPVQQRNPRPYHRVTQLSSEPSQRIGAVCKAQIVGWATLPLKLITRRLIASHYLSTRRAGYVRLHKVLSPLPTLNDLSLRSIGVQMSRIALCGILELAIDLSLWGCQYLAVTWMGTNSFGWGSL